MSNFQSNPISEYDFGEIPEEITEQDDEIMHVNKQYKNLILGEKSH
jgi:hypothetical protein